MTVINWLAVLTVLVTSLGLLLIRDWRWSLVLLAVQYAAIFLLVLATWPVAMAAVKLVAGWMACAILGMSHLLPAGEPAGGLRLPENRIFRILTAGLVLVSGFALAPALADWLGVIGQPRAWASILLIGMGLLQLGLTGNTLQVFIGLLTVLGGFEILYAAVENSTLVAALLAVITLGLALVGAYVIDLENAEAAG